MHGPKLSEPDNAVKQANQRGDDGEIHKGASYDLLKIWYPDNPADDEADGAPALYWYYGSCLNASAS